MSHHDEVTDLMAQVARQDAELAAARQRISEQSERIAELYNSQKNMFLSLRGDGDVLTAAWAESDRLRAELAAIKDAPNAPWIIVKQDREIEQLKSELAAGLAVNARMANEYGAAAAELAAGVARAEKAEAEIARLREALQQIYDLRDAEDFLEPLDEAISIADVALEPNWPPQGYFR